MHKIVINTCYGGFEYSPLAVSEIYKRKNPGAETFFYKELNYDWDSHKSQLIKSNPENADYVFSKDFGEKCEVPLWNQDYHILDIFDRHDPDCVAIVEELGDKANGEYAKLEVVQIEDDKYIIHEYDGWEWIETPSSPKEWIHIE